LYSAIEFEDTEVLALVNKLHDNVSEKFIPKQDLGSPQNNGHKLLHDK